jgi:signal transduction histidine kinase
MRTSDLGPIRALWRITTFRLTVLYGVVFALGTVALLGMVYLQSAVYLTHRVDGILETEADALARSPSPGLAQRIGDALAVNGDQTSVFALFSPNGVRIAGNLPALPPRLNVDGPPIEIPPTPIFHAHARLIARRLPGGQELVVGRDVNQLREIRAIISRALLWSGVAILVAGLACGAALSLRPLRRLRVLRAAAQEIAAGDLKRRMPIGGDRDELDIFAGAVNYMMGEVERLMSEVKGSTETIAHDLRTPLTRVRAQLHRIRHAGVPDPEGLARVIAEIDEVLDRFRAILRISELEARSRRAGFSRVDPAELIAQVAELYLPLAEAGGVALITDARPGTDIEADPKLLFEAISNLVDNAIKFTGAGGTVRVGLEGEADRPVIVVEDNGPGVPEAERESVLRRFYRSERNRVTPGSGLGLSIVAAIVRLHQFKLLLEDARPGLRVVIPCRAEPLNY